MKYIRKISDNLNDKSLATKMRRKRFLLFQNLLGQLALPIKILDVGGTRKFWLSMGLIPSEEISITILNRQTGVDTIPPFYYYLGDAREMKQFASNEFDVVFSNSVIEHVGSFKDQMKMATEIQRVGKFYFLQTPNKYFPLEPHFLFPFFQFLPHSLQLSLLMNFNMGWMKKASYSEAKELANSIRLLSKKELLTLFPNASLYTEKFMGATKSFIVYYWRNPE